MTEVVRYGENIQDPVSLPTAQWHTIVVKRRKASIVQMSDLNFHFNSSVLLPAPTEAISWKKAHVGGLKCIARGFQHVLDTKEMLMVAGHTDTAGGPDVNRRLSDARAKNVLSFMKGDHQAWATACAKHLIEDYQLILTWIADIFRWDCDPGGTDGVHGTKTSSAMRSFRATNNRLYSTSLPNSGAGPAANDWHAFADLYDRHLEKKVDLKAARAGLTVANPATLACGENWPIEAAGQDNVRSQTNRRVDLVFLKEQPVDLVNREPPGARLYGSRLFYDKQYLAVEPDYIFPFSF